MKFMKLGSKPDSFQSEGDNVRFVFKITPNLFSLYFGYNKILYICYRSENVILTTNLCVI